MQDRKKNKITQLDSEKVLRFCALYRKPDRKPREEAEMALFHVEVFQTASRIVWSIARKAGFFDEDMVTDCITGLVDFCCKQYDAEKMPSFSRYMNNIARAYLLKHRDFLSFSKRMTECGFDSRDYLTQSVYGSPDTQPKAVSQVHVDEDIDACADICGDDIDPYYALTYSTEMVVEAMEEPASDDVDWQDLRSTPVSLSAWVDMTITYVRSAEIGETVLSERAAEILRQIRAVSSASLADIAKRLMARARSGCAVSRVLLERMVETLDPENSPTLITKILAALDILAEREQDAVPESDAGETVNHEVDRFGESVCVAAGKKEDSEVKDLGELIDPKDLYKGRTPPRKPGLEDTPPSFDEVPEPKPTTKVSASVQTLPQRTYRRGFPPRVVPGQIELRLGVAS
ncbi:hypothetical protein ACSSZE_12860 [Acidithiobacillus caldus]